MAILRTKETEIVDVDFVEGVDKAVEKVTKFIDEKLAQSVDFESDVELVLSQLATGNTSAITRITYSPGEPPDIVAQQIVDAAVEDGEEIGHGICKYTVTIDGRKGRCAFALEYPEKSDDEVDEAPNERGVTAQLMRHNERVIKMNASMFDITVKSLRQANGELSQENRDLRKMYADTARLYAEMCDHQMERQLTVNRETKSEARKDEIVGMLKTTAPFIAQRFLGPKAGGPSPGEEVMYRWLESIKPEQFQKLAPLLQDVLSQEQLIGFSHIITLFQERWEKDHKAQNGVAGPAKPAPEASAALPSS